MADAVTIALSAAVLGQSALTLTLLAARPSQANLPLAGFFAANAATDAAGMAVSFDPTLNSLLTPLQLPFTLLLGPSFWFYVVFLTSETPRPWRLNDAWHLAPLLFASLFLAVYFTLPAATLEALNSGAATPQTPHAIAAVALFVAIQFLWIGQSGAYLVAVFRRLIAYRRRLKDLFASTERRELGWISVLALFLAPYWLYEFGSQFASMFMGLGANERFDAMLALILVWLLSYWGLRQAPGFAHAAAHEADPSPVETKYERSALSREQAERIGAKIETAMAQDRLYRNPNLSLRDLCNHIGAPPNYVSQTLNETLGQSFFDYVSHWRIGEAKSLLASTPDSVVSIALAVGFNSRSAFYKAFQREVGATPSAYRRQHGRGG